MALKEELERQLDENAKLEELVETHLATITHTTSKLREAEVLMDTSLKEKSEEVVALQATVLNLIYCLTKRNITKFRLSQYTFHDLYTEEYNKNIARGSQNKRRKS